MHSRQGALFLPGRRVRPGPVETLRAPEAMWPDAGPGRRRPTDAKSWRKDRINCRNFPGRRRLRLSRRVRSRPWASRLPSHRPPQNRRSRRAQHKDREKASIRNASASLRRAVARPRVSARDWFVSASGEDSRDLGPAAISVFFGSRNPFFKVVTSTSLTGLKYCATACFVFSLVELISHRDKEPPSSRS